MNNPLPKLPGMDVATVCAEHMRRIQLLSGKFWKGEIDMWHYRKTTRELIQQLVNELATLLNRTIG